ncbi:AraC family transcriptional regulator [Streptomyces sp. NPDC002779]|uniref:AraC family transcriptional regulator n=1 Tax=Streptomyces sp. NPDC002779 TaxID=3364664 RepID=UPI00369E0F8D
MPDRETQFDGLLHGTGLFPDARVPVHTGRHRLTGNVPGHSHDFLEIALVVSGQGRHLTAASGRPLAPGDVIVLRPGPWHSYVDCTRLTVVNCCFGTELLRADLAWIRTEPAVNHLLWGGPSAPGNAGVFGFRLDAEHHTRCLSLLGELAAAAGHDGPIGRIGVLGRLAVFLDALAAAAPQAPAPSSQADAPSAHPLVLGAVRLLESNLAQAWTPARLAAELAVSAGHLTRMFTNHIGLPPMAYLARARAESAAALLRSTTQPVARVGATVGWPDPNYFSRRFRTHYGLSPTAYRAAGSAPSGPGGEPGRGPSGHST